MSITALPLELCGMVEGYLPNCDIKNLRLVSRDFLNKFCLRLDRVFLSANTLNIQVFRSIADHETFRHHVVEIIWDDSLLAETSNRSLYWSVVDLRNSRYFVDDDPTLNWYDLVCRNNIHEMQARGSCFGGPSQLARDEQAAAALTFDENWDYYRKLLGQQREAIKSEADIEALKYGLERFPALRRVTMTSDAHGFLFAPKYGTPMIRSFPYGFNYPIPNGWPYRDEDMHSERNLTQEQATAKEAMGALPQPPSRWPRVLHQLATLEHHHITEVLVQSHEKCAAFQTQRFRTQAEEDTYVAGLPLEWRGEYYAHNPRTDYERPRDFEALLSRPGLRRLEVLFHLKISLYLEYYRMAGRFHSCRHTALKRALAEATDLEHFHIRFQINGFSRVFDLRDWTYLCLDAMLPLNRWPKLQHFGLEMCVVAHEELISLLRNLPQTLRSVRLSHLRFTWELEHKNMREDPYLLHRLAWKCLLRRIREDLDWRTRPVGSRPRISVHIPFLSRFYFPRSRYVCLDEEANDFVYGDGPNPFDDCMTEDGEEDCVGTGVIRDTLEPEFESYATWY